MQPVDRNAAARRIAGISLSLLLTVTAVAGQPGEYSLDPLPDKYWDRSAAAHLLRRAGFGGSVAEVDKLHALGLEAAVDYLVDYDKIPYAVAPPPFPDELEQNRFSRERMRGLSREQRQKLRQEQRRLTRRAFEETRLWWIDRMANSPRPLEEKMTLFWHGHLTSGIREVRSATLMKEQNEFLRAHALANFEDLLMGISKDRAMLVYLDGQRNRKSHPNENYARELLELFALGEGNYSERDVKAAARAFTGWGFDDRGFVFRPRQHDYGRKSFLGDSGKHNGNDIIEIILEQRACSEHLSASLLEFFVEHEPDSRIIKRLAAEIRRQDYELKPVMRTLLKSRAFYHPTRRGALIKSPVEVVIGTAHMLDVPLRDYAGARVAMQQMGQELMQPPNVKGWDAGPSWINTATLYKRYNIVGALLEGNHRGRLAQRSVDRASNDEVVDFDEDAGDGMMGSMVSGDASPRSRLGRGAQPPYEPTGLLRYRGLTTPVQIVDFYVSHLLATPLADYKRAALIEFLNDGGKFDLEGRDADVVIRQLVHLICSTPEFQLN